MRGGPGVWSGWPFDMGYPISVLSEPELGQHCQPEVRPGPSQSWSLLRLSFEFLGATK